MKSVGSAPSAASPNAQGPAPNRGFSLERRKHATLIFGLTLLALCGCLSWRQPTPDKLDPPAQFPSWKWFFYPHEINPENRPPKQKRPLRAVAVVPGSGGQSAFAVGDHGTVLETTDAGENWKLRLLSVDASFSDVSFTDSKNGLIVGSDNSSTGIVLLTTDGGAHWIEHRIGSSRKIDSVAAANGQTAWAISQYGNLLYTTNGGGTWNSMPIGMLISRASDASNERLTRTSFVDTQTGWAVTNLGTILFTLDAGANWRRQKDAAWWIGRPVDTPTSSNPSKNASAGARLAYPVGEMDPKTRAANFALLDVIGGNNLVAWAFGANGIILSTTDGGTHWTPQARPTNETLLRASFADLHTGWAVGNRGAILHTIDGGAHWTLQATANQTLNGVAAANPQAAWVVGPYTIRYTSDGGAPWAPQEYAG
jgi:photosystem II stability/assembly factor-like uncharacterized protein